MVTIDAVEMIQSAASVFVIGRLIHLKQVTRFGAASAWLGGFALASLALGLFPSASAPYFWTYIVYGATFSVLSVFVVREMFSLVFRNYPGIRYKGRQYLYISLALAGTSSLLIARLFQRTSAHGSIHLFYVEAVQRSVFLILAFVISTFLIFLSRYPLHLSRNTYVSSAFFSVLFLSESLRLLIDSLAPYLFSPSVDLMQGVFTTLCLTAWGLLLEPATAARPAPPSVPTAREEHLLQQLAALNQLLGRAARQ